MMPHVFENLTLREVQISSRIGDCDAVGHRRLYLVEKAEGASDFSVAVGVKSEFSRAELSSARKMLREFSGGSGSCGNPLESILVVQTSQDGLGQYLMIARNPVSGESLHRVPSRRFGYRSPQGRPAGRYNQSIEHCNASELERITCFTVA